MAPFKDDDEVTSVLRRPCMLRCRSEWNIDTVEGRRAFSPPPRQRSRDTTMVDDRALTLDTQERCGLHRAGYDRKPVTPDQGTHEVLSSMQALGMPCNSHIGMLSGNNKRKVNPPSCSQPRPKVEQFVGLPVGGTGADIDVLAGLRRGLTGTVHRHERTANEGKRELHRISIDHQFHRARSVSPPPTEEILAKDEVQHRFRADGYSNLLGRPEGVTRLRLGSQNVRSTICMGSTKIQSFTDVQRCSIGSTKIRSFSDVQPCISQQAQAVILALRSLPPRVLPQHDELTPVSSVQSRPMSPQVDALDAQSTPRARKHLISWSSWSSSFSESTGHLSPHLSNASVPTSASTRTSGRRDPDALKDEQRKATRRAKWVA
jgi:hypothetical protein